MNKFIPYLCLLVSLISIAISIENTEKINSLNFALEKIENNSINKKDNEDSLSNDDASNTSEISIKRELFTGILRKEKIPEEMELGEYWYWFYFDSPYLLENNSSGKPMLVNKIQAISPNRLENEMDEYVDKKLDIIGYMTWGYAESNVIQVEEVFLR